MNPIKPILVASFFGVFGLAPEVAQSVEELTAASIQDDDEVKKLRLELAEALALVDEESDKRRLAEVRSEAAQKQLVAAEAVVAAQEQEVLRIEQEVLDLQAALNELQEDLNEAEEKVRVLAVASQDAEEAADTAKKLADRLQAKIDEIMNTPITLHMGAAQYDRTDIRDKRTARVRFALVHGKEDGVLWQVLDTHNLRLPDGDHAHDEIDWIIVTVDPKVLPD